MKRILLVAIFTILFAANIFAITSWKDSNAFIVRWAKSINAEGRLDILAYDGSELTAVNNEYEITVEPEDNVTPVPVFMIRFTTNKRGTHDVTVSSRKLRVHDSDETAFEYKLVFSVGNTDYDLTVENDDESITIPLYVNSLNGFVATDVLVDAVFTRLDEMSSEDDYSSYVTVEWSGL